MCMYVALYGKPQLEREKEWEPLERGATEDD